MLSEHIMPCYSNVACELTAMPKLCHTEKLSIMNDVKGNFSIK